MFLTKHDLIEMTGYKLPSKQTGWLKRAGVKFTLNRYGHPLVLSKHIEELLCNSPTKKTSRRIEPDELGLKEAIGLT